MEEEEEEGGCLSPAARQQAEARLAAKRAARAEAREIRMKELERQQKEIEERPEKDFEKGARTVSSLSAATLASLGGTSSRRGSGDTSISADTEASIREIKDSLAEVEEKYKKAMVSNAQLDNEKTNFMYQVDTLKDALLELEEQLAESRRQYEEKSKEFEREKHAHSILQFQFMEIKEALKQREEMLAEIQQLQKKQQNYVREISDLQETIEWKDKKIGALERQKDFFDSIRSERDDLRDEVVVLKEQLKKHGIIPDSDVATNGETSDILDNEGHLDSSKNVPGTTQALKPGSEAMLGKANEVDMKNEILEDVGKREILQNTEREEHKEESEEQEVQTLHADENAEAENMVEEWDALSTAMLPGSRFTEQIQSLAEAASGSAASNDGSDTDDLRKEAESTGRAVQQPVSTEAEHHDLNARTTQNVEVGSLQGHQTSESPQEMPSVLGTEHELEEAVPEGEEQEDLTTSHGPSSKEMDQEANVTSESCELVCTQAELPEVMVAGLPSEERNEESHVEELQCSEESAEKVIDVLEEELVESKDFTDGQIDETGGDTAEEEDEVGNTVQGQTREMESVGLEGTESCESGVPADTSEQECGGDQAHIPPASSEDSAPASSEEQNKQDKAKLENSMAEKDGQKEVVLEELDKCPDSAEAGKQDKASVEAAGCIMEIKGNVLQQAEPDTDVVKEVRTQENSSDPSVLDDKIKESKLETRGESGKGKESRTEQVEDLQAKVEAKTVQCSDEETTSDEVGEKNTDLGQAQNVVKQEEGESTEEPTVDVSVTAENKVDKETLEENEQGLEFAGHDGEGFASEEAANSSLAQKAEQDENVSEGQAEERLEDDGDAFDFDEESKQILETAEKCDGDKADREKEGGDGVKGAVRKAAPTDKAGERTSKTETKDALTEDDSLQHKKGDEPEETSSLEGEASWKTDEKTDVMEDEIKASDSNEVEKIPDEDVSEQDLESAGSNRDESKEDLQGGRRGKGKSRDDCTIS